MCKKCSQSLRCKFVTIDKGRWSVSSKLFIWILVVLSKSEGDYLGGEVCIKLLLACRACRLDIHSPLIFPETDELQWDDVCSLVKELVERVLAVGARFSEDYRTCYIVDWLAVSVYMLSV